MASTFEALLLAQVNLALNPPILEAHQATAQTLTTGTNTKITLDTVDSDSYSGWSAANNQYATQVPGTYEILGGIGFGANATGQRQVWVEVNSVLVTQSLVSQNATSSGSWNGATRSYQQQLNVGDTVQLWSQQSSGGGLATVNTPFLHLRLVHL